MPKNAVQRLQKIENDLKAAISIYDIANKLNNENDRPETPENEDAPRSPPFKSYKKTIGFDTQYFQDVYYGKSRLMSKRPDSAPSSASTLSTICELDYVGQSSSESINRVEEKRFFSKKQSHENLKNLSEFNSNNTSIYDLLMTPSKTLQTADEILAENKFKKNEGPEEGSEPYFNELVRCIETKDILDSRSNFQNEEDDPTVNVKSVSSLKRSSSFNTKKLKEELENENITIERSRSAPPRKKNSLQKGLPQPLHSAISESIGNTKLSADSKKNKTSLVLSPKCNTIPKKLPRLESPRSDSCDKKNNAKQRNEIKNSQEKSNKPGSGKTEKGDRLIKKIDSNDDGGKNARETKSKLSEKNSTRLRQERSAYGILFANEKKLKFSPAANNCNNQKKIRKITEKEDLELWVKELSKIIEVSNEKLEKMKFSKELALDIAKYLKNKYDEIQQSKEELLERVQRVEEDNERLKNEIKEAHQSKVKLQMKVEGLKKDSKTKLTEQNAKTQSVLEENASLKNRISDTERHCKEELLKKQKEIDEIQRERLAEIKNELKSRENREEEVQRLKNEKSELQCQLNDRQSKTEILEEKIFQLQEEVQKQRQHLKNKTERLEETNKELESIRQNSNDLEEQVKTLRKNIENFDGIQQSLMKQTAAYNEQIKSNQEEIKRLQEENSKLKIELDKEKDAQLIKTKIIEDLQETLKQLKEKSEEAKALLKKNQSLERILNTEREEKLELQEAVERLKRRKEELKKKINSLENDLLLAPQEVVRDLRKTQIVLRELENQVQIKQKEWELQFQTLLREKEQACNVAEFATKKLMQTTSEFQKQSQAHKRLQIILAENLAEKEKNLLEVNEKISLAQSKQNLSSVRLDDKISRWLKNRHESIVKNDDVVMDWHFNNASGQPTTQK